MPPFTPPTPVSYPVFWNISARAKRLSLRIDPARRGVVITLPPGVSRAQGAAFLQTRLDWTAAALADLPPPVSERARLMLEGRDYPVISVPTAKRGVWLENDALHVSGDPAHLERRLRDWLKERALKTLPPLAQAHATRTGLIPAKIVLRDVRSRWGSCTRQGRLMLSWRLLLAPPEIRDYVMLHELAHLRHFNHGPDFWRLVDLHLPDGRPAREKAERWLKENGAQLLAAI